MSSSALTKSMLGPSLLDEILRPWDEWFDNSGMTKRTLSVPAVNLKESADRYTISVASPGMSKEDFKIALDGNLLTISAEKEERKEEEKYTRQEYNYTSFSRSFSLPEDVVENSIDARYEDGVLNIRIPRREAKDNASVVRKIAVN